jgi:hypothetical protein
MSVSDHLEFLRSEIRSCDEVRLLAQGMRDSQARTIVYESVLLRAFRAYENYVERVFLSYLIGETREDGLEVPRFVSPRDWDHARKIVSPSGRFLDWSEPSVIRERCDVFFERDDPVYIAVGGKTTELNWMRKVRNHVAHNSVESATQFAGVLRAVLLTEPTPIPSPGDFLQVVPARGPMRGREVLACFLAMVTECSETAAGATA